MLPLGRWTWTTCNIPRLFTRAEERDVYRILCLNTQMDWLQTEAYTADKLLGMWTTATLCREFLGDQSFRLGEIPATLTIWSDAGCGMGCRVEAGCLATVDVLA